MKKSVGLVLLVGISLLVFNWNLLTYLIGQGQGQFEVLYHAESIDDYADRESIDSLQQAKIALIQEVKQFCLLELGMECGDKYSTIYDQKGEDILWNLTACEPFALNSKEWSFPLIGTVSYKGFFDLEKAKKEQKVLDDQGYDTRIRPVSAWSTLGWFNDPILSKTLERSEGSLAELIIHEVTHAHIFIADSLTFNENIASFIGEHGARLFLKNRFGVYSAQWQAYLNAEDDFQLFTDHVLTSKDLLTVLYDSFEETEPYEQKLKAKQKFMEEFVWSLDTIPFADSTRFEDAFQAGLPNNAFFMAFDRYASMKESMQLEMDNKFGGSLKNFIEYYKNVSE